MTFGSLGGLARLQELHCLNVRAVLHDYLGMGSRLKNEAGGGGQYNHAEAAQGQAGDLNQPPGGGRADPGARRLLAGCSSTRSPHLGPTQRSKKWTGAEQSGLQKNSKAELI